MATDKAINFDFDGILKEKGHRVITGVESEVKYKNSTVGELQLIKDEDQNKLKFIFNDLGETFKGEPGKDGQDGKSVKFDIGTVKTGDTAAATIESNGEDENGNRIYVLNLTLPAIKGDQGPQGPKGEKPKVAIGEVKTVSSISEAKVEIRDKENTDPDGHYDFILDFYIPPGARGEQGPQGDPFTLYQGKTFTSVAELREAAANEQVPIGSYVLINAGDVENEENNQLYYVNNSRQLSFVGDFSGKKGAGSKILVHSAELVEPEDSLEILMVNDGPQYIPEEDIWETQLDFKIPKGAPGLDSTFDSIDVSTLSSKENATATIVKNSADDHNGYNLSLGIPRGTSAKINAPTVNWLPQFDEEGLPNTATATDLGTVYDDTNDENVSSYQLDIPLGASSVISNLNFESPSKYTYDEENETLVPNLATASIDNQYNSDTNTNETTLNLSIPTPESNVINANFEASPAYIWIEDEDVEAEGGGYYSQVSSSLETETSYDEDSNSNITTLNFTIPTPASNEIRFNQVQTLEPYMEDPDNPGELISTIPTATAENTYDDATNTNITTFSLGIPKGKIPTISIGTVEATESDGEPSASIRYAEPNTYDNAILDLVLPRGPQGERGDIGNVDLGVAISNGTLSITLENTESTEEPEPTDEPVEPTEPTEPTEEDGA